ncbi:hypothetical protein [Natrialbaceae archaeon AArc-T1-2]|uniref:hypothetical protein n=1 Tax=Natrialbaceae archaeon AArc-T1-2 TaxID=3053904 RepID=UPI00255AF1EE|nr:hypothetical protein [Natrialbaceae archaeon AArc-T1-2]WIV67717.1 hypothetical protein QQ977_03005 [Natrialbaceae archaeon AArc-T1-2]
MTGEPFAPREANENDRRPEGTESDRKLSWAGELGRAVAHVRADPFLFVPFALAGLVLSVLDRLRLRDPVPVLVERGLQGSTIVEYSIYPTGTPESARRIGALVDLETPYLIWAVGLEVVAVLSIAIAGWYTIARAAGESTTAGLGSYVGFVVLVAGVTRLLGSIGEITLQGILGLAVFLVVFFAVLILFARLFVAPALAALGTSPWTAVRRSVALTGGHERALVLLVLGYGILVWLLGSVPYVGALVSSVVVAVVHAVSTVTVLESVTDGSLE